MGSRPGSLLPQQGRHVGRLYSRTWNAPPRVPEAVPLAPAVRPAASSPAAALPVAHLLPQPPPPRLLLILLVRVPLPARRPSVMDAVAVDHSRPCARLPLQRPPEEVLQGDAPCARVLQRRGVASLAGRARQGCHPGNGVRLLAEVRSSTHSASAAVVCDCEDPGLTACIDTDPGACTFHFPSRTPFRNPRVQCCICHPRPLGQRPNSILMHGLSWARQPHLLQHQCRGVHVPPTCRHVRRRVARRVPGRRVSAAPQQHLGGCRMAAGTRLGQQGRDMLETRFCTRRRGTPCPLKDSSTCHTLSPGW